MTVNQKLDCNLTRSQCSRVLGCLKVVIIEHNRKEANELKQAFQPNPHYDVVSVNSTTKNGAAAVRRWRPDLVVLDLELPNFGASKILAQIRNVNPSARVVLRADERLCSLLCSGHLVLSKSEASEELLKKIPDVVTSSPAFCCAKPLNLEVDGDDAPSAALTSRERQIAAFVGEGYSNKAIARKLGISDGTVKVHLHNAYRKLGISSRAALALEVQKLAHRRGLLSGTRATAPTDESLRRPNRQEGSSPSSDLRWRRCPLASAHTK